MIKNFLAIIAVAAIVSSCGSATSEKKSDNEAAAVNIEFASLIEDPTQFLNKEITVEGNVVHVCTHSGKKMFIVGENPDIRLFITVGEELPKFPMELLGSNISVTGTLAMVEAGEKMGEGEHKEGEMKEGEMKEGEHAEGTMGEAAEDCETEAAVAAQPVLAEYVLHYAAHEVK